MMKIFVAFVLVLAVAVRAADPPRLYTFESDKGLDITGEFGKVTKDVENLAQDGLRSAGGFLARRKDREWLTKKIAQEKEWKESREESFDGADEDKDGSLKDGKEVIEALVQHMTTKNSGNAVFDAKQWLDPCKAEAACAQALFERVDLDQDGQVNKKEYHDYIFDSLEDEVHMVQKRANRKVLRALRSADTDKDGIISRDESVQWFADMDFALENVYPPPTYESFDENKDGTVTKQEFSRQLLKMVRDSQGWGPTKDEILEAGDAALDLGASMLEENGRARSGFWNAYALKRLAKKESSEAQDDGKVN